jgi:TRAP-type mannitol/chloroaromatic compound transport system permease large subunit
LEFISQNFVPLMFAGLLFFLLDGFPVVFGLVATGLAFGFLGMQVGLFPPALFQALPLRIFGIMQNETLLAIPFFCCMGIVLERSGLAEDLLESIGQVFGPVRGGLIQAVVFVGALLAATTGVVSAAVITMGLISLPVMLRYGYHPGIAAGAINASGVLTQVIPPSVILIVLGDQLGRSVGDMYAGVLVPGLMQVGLFSLFIIILAIFRPNWVPALPPEARIYKEENGASGHKSLLALLAISTVAAFAWAAIHDAIINPLVGRAGKAPTDEIVILATTAGVFTALLLASGNRLLRLGLLSKLSERVTFVLIPPLVLIFLVLGTIFLGIATPTEGGAMGAIGALIMAVLRRRLSFGLLKQALDNTAQVTCFIMFILIGATVFSFTFNAANGSAWVAHLFDKLPGGQLGFLIVVNLLIFILGCFIDFFEIAFIVMPILVPVADKMGIDLVWFGIILTMNFQTSFLTPPFGFALFYLRSVAPKEDYIDRVTNRRIPAVKTAEIWKGGVPFIILQIAMVVVVMAFPHLVTDRLDKGPAVNIESLKLEPEPDSYGAKDDEDLMKTFAPRPAEGQAPPQAGGAAKEEDPTEAVRRAIEQDAKKK